MTLFPSLFLSPLTLLLHSPPSHLPKRASRATALNFEEGARNFTIEHVRSSHHSQTCYGSTFRLFAKSRGPTNNPIYLAILHVLDHNPPLSFLHPRRDTQRSVKSAKSRYTRVPSKSHRYPVDARRDLFSGPLSSPRSLSSRTNVHTHARIYAGHTLANTDVDAPKSQPSFDTPFPTSSDVLTTRNRQNTRTRRRERDGETQMG